MAARVRVGMSPEALFVISATFLSTAILSILALPDFWENANVMVPAVTIDLSIGLPVVGYFFLVRTRRVGSWVLIPLFLLGPVLVQWWIPESRRDLPGTLELAAVLFEGGLLLAFLLRVRRIRRLYRVEQHRQPYSLDAMRVAVDRVMGRRVGGAVFSEVSALWYGFAGWGRRSSDRPAGEVFSGHRRNGYPALLGAFLLIVLVETAAVHLLVSLWLGPVAWVLTALGIYSMVWLLGDFHAARLNPSFLTESHLHLRTGLRWSADIPLADIVGVHDAPPAGKVVRMTMFGAPDFWLECAEPTVVAGVFGIQRRVRFIGVGVDDPAGFRNAIGSRRPTGQRAEADPPVPGIEPATTAIVEK